MPTESNAMLADIVRAQTDTFQALLGTTSAVASGGDAKAADENAVNWAGVVGRMQSLWQDYQIEQLQKVGGGTSPLGDPAKWAGTIETVLRQLPLSDPDVHKHLWEEGISLVNAVLGQYGMGPDAAEQVPELPLLPLGGDRRFGDAAWSSKPFFAVIHQLYLLLSQRLVAMAEASEGVDASRKAQLVFAARAVADALSPSNFPLTNPLAMAKAAETQGESLVRGFENLIDDLRKGQIVHSSPGAFTLGENIAVTPGKVIAETPLYQLIQYTPTTDKVLATPLVIFPPWINRFYILDLNAKKSFVRWAVEQGITVFMVSWKSADASMADMVWDDYIAAQIAVIDLVRERLKVPAVHTVGYCVAGTTLAATLAILARKGEGDKVASATFLTAQVDFEEAGDLKNFVDDAQIDAIGKLSTDGYLDGRYLAATFNILRGNDLIWSHVERNYLKGEDRPAFDLLHWNGDVTNLPARWHRDYLRDLYRDNRLVVPDSLQAGGVPIDLRRITTPCYIQAGREDHIAPPRSVWKLTRHLAGPWTFLLAGSGHIAGVVNPPSANKYQYWVNGAPVDSLEAFVSGASEHRGSWWPHWAQWIEALDGTKLPAKGKRRPGGRGDKAIEDAPGRYVMTR
ncbi:PHA/PHB synthase family protein [Novosphingobium sp. 9]|uniref:PHA/PHB synthase family protein n=1 Tax=Novosphingobium sp. 9 TaxID=2025349 RepID=UPI0021B58373|nr:alpha/beta fold hydrolase [Novosphingobium sp. 9]